MGAVEEKILLYHRLWLGFLVAFLLCLALCVILFFVLRIPEVLGYNTGDRKSVV